ncbi:MAG TPA: TlpA disulfide reductase family protein [Caulobacteraceae bacterium]|nr:TlpA disulfide reductase family protein [Caulobacteraceae bacterium]
MLSRIRVWTIVLAAAVLVGGPASAARVGRPAPGFTLVTLDHQKYSLADLRGKVVVLNFWATWCTPCKAELAAMNNYARRHPGEGLAIFAIKTDDYPAYKLTDLAKALPFPVVADFRSWDYGEINNQVPSSYVIDRAGVLRLMQAGAFNEDGFDQTITPLLAQPAPPAEVAAAGSHT